MSRIPGFVLWRGPSLLDGAPIAVVITGFSQPSENEKTGQMLQSWILRSDLDPRDAHAAGLDRSVCGDCPWRDGACYVNLTTGGPRAVYAALRRGTYPDFVPRQHLRLLSGRLLRVGSYGDPAATPFLRWLTLFGVVDGWTGYTHQHAERGCDPRWKHFLMASVETAAGRLDAKERGWRTFRLRPPGTPLLPGEIDCPASALSGHRRTCATCLACRGVLPSDRAADVSIEFHGSASKATSYQHWLDVQFGRGMYTVPGTGRRRPLPITS